MGICSTNYFFHSYYHCAKLPFGRKNAVVIFAMPEKLSATEHFGLDGFRKFMVVTVHFAGPGQAHFL